jgi:hypothetical protein
MVARIESAKTEWRCGSAATAAAATCARQFALDLPRAPLEIGVPPTVKSKIGISGLVRL